MKNTPLSTLHEKNGAKMTEFANFNMPVYFTSIIEEHNLVRTKAGIFDLYHMGEFWLHGKDAMKNIQKLVTQDLEAISDRQIVYTTMCRENGTIVDDLLVYRWNMEKFLLVVNAANIKKDFDWIKGNLEGSCTLEDCSETIGLIAIQGPLAQQILQKLTKLSLKNIKFYWFSTTKIDGIDTIISRTGYTGEDGFELYFPVQYSEKLWNMLLEAGKEEGLKPCGLGSRDTLRLEARLMLYGNDISDEDTPLEANLDWSVKFSKGYFIGYEALKKQKEEGIKKTLVGFEMGKGPSARHGYNVYKNGKLIGKVTSGAYSPTLQKNIGLAYVPVEYKQIGTELEIEIRDKLYKATVVSTPFYIPVYARKK